MSDATPMKPATVAAQALGWIEETTKAVAPALHPSSTFIRDEDNQYRSGRNYSRADNPSYDQAEAVLASLENGAAAALFASGMAAANAVFMSLKPGDHVVISRVMYWSLRAWLLGFATHWGLKVEIVDTTDLAALKAAMQPGRTALVWIETPGNPTLAVTDIAATAQIAHAAGARLAVDSTVATPVFTRPLDLGADIVMHSATKSLNGHSDIIAGALVTRVADEHWETIKRIRIQSGAVLGTFEAWLLLRGMRTLYPRVRTASANAMAVAQHFRGHPLVEDVLYPGLTNFPGHEVAAKQMQGGFGSLMSIRTRGGEKGAIATAANVKIWKRATSLGGVESLIEHRSSVEGPNSPAPSDLLRMSVGIEEVSDLIGDFEQALKAANK
jgi:cystathionine gamma-synthase